MQNFQECGSDSNVKDTSKEILFNPNVFTEFKLGGNQEVAYVAFPNYHLA